MLLPDRVDAVYVSNRPRRCGEQLEELYVHLGRGPEPDRGHRLWPSRAEARGGDHCLPGPGDRGTGVADGHDGPVRVEGNLRAAATCASMDGKPCEPRHRARRAADRRSLMNTATTKPRNPVDPSTPSERDDVGRARKNDPSRRSSRLFMPLRWLRRKLSSAVGWVRAQIRSPARLVKSVLATIGKD